jgi:hypothetical protein
MGKPFRQNGTGYSHVHVTTVIVPQLGKSAGLQFTLQQHSSADYDNNAKTAAIEGPQMNPVQLAPGGADPSWNFETSLDEARKLLSFIGPGYLTIPLDIQHTWQLPKKKAITDFIDGALIEKDGTKSQRGNATMVSIGGKCAGVRPDGVDPYTVPT